MTAPRKKRPKGQAVSGEERSRKPSVAGGKVQEAPETRDPDEEDIVEKPADPDGRVPPDHQRDARVSGRPPEQEVVERAREQQAPPVNPDPRLDEDATGKIP